MKSSRIKRRKFLIVSDKDDNNRQIFCYSLLMMEGKYVGLVEDEELL